MNAEKLGNSFDVALRNRHPPLDPAGDLRRMYAKLAGKLFARQAAPVEMGFQRVHDADDSCASCNQCQAPSMRKLLTTTQAEVMHNVTMSNFAKIHPGKQPRRPHFLAEWAERRSLRQADIAMELNCDKSVVSRWFSGSTPSPHWQERLAALFGLDSPDALFRHPDEDWLSRFFAGRTRDEIERAKQALEIMFPRKVA